MPRKKTKCPSCLKDTSSHTFAIDFVQCDECDEWRVGSFLTLPLAMVMVDRGFDFHGFAARVDEVIEESKKFIEAKKAAEAREKAP
jgi:hypothetical protein